MVTLVLYEQLIFSCNYKNFYLFIYSNISGIFMYIFHIILKIYSLGKIQINGIIPDKL